MREAHLAGEPVYDGDAAERAVLESVGIGSARLLLDVPLTPRSSAVGRLLEELALPPQGRGKWAAPETETPPRRGP